MSILDNHTDDCHPALHGESAPHAHDVHALTSDDIARRIQTAEQLCADKGVRFTPLRRAVYQLILKSDKPLGAYDLIQSLQDSRAQEAGKKAKLVAPPTIYRTLEFLLEFGFIHQLTSINAYVPCCHPRDEHNAVFLMCKDCKRVQEFSGMPVQNIVSYVKEEVGFSVEQSIMELKGLCQTCANTVSATELTDQLDVQNVVQIDGHSADQKET